MMEQYLMAQDYHHAFIYGEMSFNNNPCIEKIYDSLTELIEDEDRIKDRARRNDETAATTTSSTAYPTSPRDINH